MNKDNFEEIKKEIISKLRSAGPAGINKSRLGITNSKTGLIRLNALNELEKDRSIVNLQTSKRSLFVLKEFGNTLERACELIDDKTSHSGIMLLSKTMIINNYGKKCPGKVREEFDKAVDLLVKEQKLFKFKYKNSLVYINVNVLKNLLENTINLPVETVTNTRLNLETVLKAYKIVKKRFEFSNVRISDLRKEIDVPMEIFKEFLLEQSRLGNAVLSLGDWSLSSDEIKNGAVYLNEKPHLLVRFIV